MRIYRAAGLATGLLVLASGSASAQAQGDPASNPDFSPVTAAVDTDKDGKMSRAEWEAAGLPNSSFNMFEQGRDYVTQEDYEKNAAPAGIDINGDGKLTVEEFIEFDKSMSGGPPGGGEGGPPPGDGEGGPPPGGPQGGPQGGPPAGGPQGGPPPGGPRTRIASR